MEAPRPAKPAARVDLNNMFRLVFYNVLEIDEKLADDKRRGTDTGKPVCEIATCFG
jgi:hypothetical protein